MICQNLSAGIGDAVIAFSLGRHHQETCYRLQARRIADDEEQNRQ
jgi:hypothetical protein